MASGGRGREGSPRDAPLDDSTPVLLDGFGDRKLRLELLRWLINSEIDQIDMAVSFIMKSGLALIADHLEAALQRGASIRILTTDYLDITDPDALATLLDLADWPAASGNAGRLEVKVFHDPSMSFHPKAYLFRSSYSSAAGGFVGSSNLSGSGIDGGVEWNLGVNRLAPLVESFERLWDDPRCMPVDARWLAAYRLRRPPDDVPRTPPPEAAVPVEPATQPVNPWPVQNEALRALEQTRIQGFRRGLVVMATGLGKTLLAAFDSNRPDFRRVLFIAHREEILRQSRDAFRLVRPDGRFGFFLGADKDPEADVVFASIQTLHCNLDHFEPDRFDYVVVDEFHHAAAPTYRRAIERFHPKFLLGLTATPDRLDGADLLALCGNNLVFEYDLIEGIRQERLSPFHYWGIKDVVDYTPIPWRNGRFDPDKLAEAIETTQRAEQTLEEWRERAAGPTLAFCTTIAHAEFMAKFFNQRGVRSLAVHSGPGSAPRQSAIEDLRSGAIQVLFAVDVFNEGVDIPEIGTVLMLRPTDSPVIFLQQLGRGLRLTDDKVALQVIDFVGNHHSFLMKPRVLLKMGPSEGTLTDRAVVEAAETGEFDLPQGCSAEFELEAVELLRQMLAQRAGKRGRAARDEAAALAEYCLNYAEEHDTRPTAAQTSRSVGIKPGSGPIKRAGGWHRYLDNLGLLSDAHKNAVEEAGDVLRALESERISKSYKLVALEVMLELGAAYGPVSVADAAERSLQAIREDHRLRADIHIKEIPNLDEVSPEKWRKYWFKWPLEHLSNRPGKSLFSHEPGDDGGMMVPTFSVSDERREAFVEMAFEVLDWRLQDYLLARLTVPEPSALPQPSRPQPPAANLAESESVG
ncbi:MAG: DEAD/DEAH box helicase family protein [bacterium]|nr:DEAD/DEAH box helicase family protein [bacterium]